MAERDAAPRSDEKSLVEPDADKEADYGLDAGAFVGREAELAQETIPGGVRPGDERISAVAAQSTGPANRGANPDEGWSKWPEGHREGRPADDDMVRRKG